MPKPADLNTPEDTLEDYSPEALHIWGSLKVKGVTTEERLTRDKQRRYMIYIVTYSPVIKPNINLKVGYFKAKYDVIRGLLILNPNGYIKYTSTPEGRSIVSTVSE